jgi:hypothetical protein
MLEIPSEEIELFDECLLDGGLSGGQRRYRALRQRDVHLRLLSFFSRFELGFEKSGSFLNGERPVNTAFSYVFEAFSEFAICGAPMPRGDGRRFRSKHNSASLHRGLNQIAFVNAHGGAKAAWKRHLAFAMNPYESRHLVRSSGSVDKVVPFKV